MQHLLDILILGNIDLSGVKGSGNSNVLSTIQTIYVWAVLIIIVGLVAFKKFRAAVGILVVGSILGVFVYGPDNIVSLGDSLLKFFGLKG